MVLEQKIVDILREDIPPLFSRVRWDGMYDETAKRIVKVIKDKLVE